MSTRMKQIGFAIMTFAVYTAIINWKVALLLTVGVGFHEYSHLWAAKRLGLGTKGFYLVPFMGGVAFITDSYKRYSQQAFVVIMGPIGGGLLALATAVAWHLTGLPFLAAAASWMCFLNVFNLLPLSFMDGGQLMDTICYSVHRTFGMVLHIISTVVAGIVLWHFNPVIAGIVIFMGGGSVVAEVREWKNYQDPNKRWLCSDAYLNPPAPLSKKEMALTAASWLVTLVILGCVRYYLSGFEEARLSSIIN